MSIKIGDPIFEKNGFPAFVKERDPEVQSIKLDSAPEKVRKNSRHGYIRGLAEDQRADFNNIMDDIREIEDPQKKVLNLQERISGLESSEPSLKNKRMVRYLKSELFHIMQTYDVFPREYQVSKDTL